MPLLTRKLPNGKLVRLFVEGTEFITVIRITGDFFCYPEEAIEEIEKRLIGLPLPISVADVQDIQKKLDAYVAGNNVTLVGITTDAIATMIKEALQ